MIQGSYKVTNLAFVLDFYFFTLPHKLATCCYLSLFDHLTTIIFIIKIHRLALSIDTRNNHESTSCANDVYLLIFVLSLREIIFRLPVLPAEMIGCGFVD